MISLHSFPFVGYLGLLYAYAYLLEKTKKQRMVIFCKGIGFSNNLTLLGANNLTLLWANNLTLLGANNLTFLGTHNIKLPGVSSYGYGYGYGNSFSSASCGENTFSPWTFPVVHLEHDMFFSSALFFCTCCAVYSMIWSIPRHCTMQVYLHLICEYM